MQYGLLNPFGFGISSVDNLRKGYPHLYRQFKSFKKKADDNPSAKYMYACFLRGYKNILPKSDYESFQPILLEAAEAGFAPAQYDYAQYQIYQERDVELGLPWLIKAAKQELTKAEYKLGDLLMHSPSPYLKEDKKKAAFWLEKAANKGHARAQLKLTKLRLAQFKETPEYAEQAIQWLEPISNQNDASPDVFYLLARAHVSLAEKSQAKEYLQEALDRAKERKWNKPMWKKFQKRLES